MWVVLFFKYLTNRCRLLVQTTNTKTDARKEESSGIKTGKKNRKMTKKYQNEGVSRGVPPT